MTLTGSIGKIQMTEDQDVDFFPQSEKKIASLEAS